MSEHTPEVIEETRITQAMDEFVSDVRHLRFVEDSRENWAAMNEFLDQHNLDAGNPEHLHFAYTNLVREGSLELLALGQYAEPQPKPAPAPTPVQSPAAAAVAQARVRTFVAFRNGQPIEGKVRNV